MSLVRGVMWQRNLEKFQFNFKQLNFMTSSCWTFVIRPYTKCRQCTIAYITSYALSSILVLPYYIPYDTIVRRHHHRWPKRVWKKKPATGHQALSVLALGYPSAPLPVAIEELLLAILLDLFYSTTLLLLFLRLEERKRRTREES